MIRRFRHFIIAAATTLTLGACMPQAGPQAGAAPPPPEADRDVFLTLVASISQGGKPQAALAYLDDYLQRYPDDRRARLLRADASARTGDLTRAETIYAALAATSAMPEAEAGLARVAARQNRWREAVHHFSAAHRQMPSKPVLLNDYGYALLMTGREDQAFSLLAKARELMPKDRRIRTNFLIAAHAAGRDAPLQRSLSDMPAGERQSLLAFIRNWEPAP